MNYTKSVSNDVQKKCKSIEENGLVSIVSSAVAKDNANAYSLTENLKTIHASALTAFDILIALKFIEAKELEKMMQPLLKIASKESLKVFLCMTLHFGNALQYWGILI